MKEKIEKLLARKKEIGEQLADEKRSFTNEEFGDLETELREINEEIEMLEKRQRLADESTAIAQGVSPAQTVATFNATQTPEARSDEEKENEYRKAFMSYVLSGEEIPSELRADAVTKTTDIGAMIPNTVLNKIVEKLEASGMILPLVTRTSVKGGVTIPTSTIKPVATWVAEGAGSEKQKKTTGSITFNYHKLRCAVAVTLETDLMALSAFEATLINNIVEAMTIALEQAIVSGDGVGKPKGILTEVPNAEQALDIAALDYKALVDAEAALPLEYENGAVYLMTKKTFMGYVGMVDTNKQPIARVNYGVSGKPERTLLGRQVVLCNYVPSFESADVGAAFAALFNFKDYALNTNYQMTVKKYEDNETDDQVTKAILIADGKVVDKGSLVILKKAAGA